MQFYNRSIAGCVVVCALVLSVFGTACSSDDGDDNNQDACTNRSADIEVAGTWTTNFGSLLVVDSETWQSAGASSEVVSYDNCENRVVTDSGSSFSKIVWTEPSGGQFWYCTVTFDASTADEARNAEVTADFDNPSQEGSCGEGFAFTKATEGNMVPDTGMGDTGMGDAGLPDAGN